MLYLWKNLTGKIISNQVEKSMMILPNDFSNGITDILFL
jgi:hypothetical protein